MVDSQTSVIADLPFAIFSPEAGPGGGEMQLFRRFAWGNADVMDPEHSDFLLLRETILGSRAKVGRTREWQDAADAR